MKQIKRAISMLLVLILVFGTLPAFSIDVQAATTSTEVTPMVAGGEYHSVLLKSDGTVWAWGRNREGQLGDGSFIDSHTPIKVDINNVVHIAAGTLHDDGYYANTYALKSDGTVWAWGSNQRGQLGIGNYETQNKPTKIDISDVKQISAGHYFVVALKNDGTVWYWGNPYYAKKMGLTATAVPKQLTAISNVRQVEAGLFHIAYLKNDGTLWVQGWDYYGQLGQGTYKDKDHPVQIDIDNVRQICPLSGSHMTGVILNDNTLLGCGENRYQSILPNSSDSVPSLTVMNDGQKYRYCKFGHTTVAINMNNQLEMWGADIWGQEETGSGVNGKQTVLDDVLVAGAPFHQAIAIKNNGDVYTWGRNDYGQLGDGTTVDKRVPTKININAFDTDDSLKDITYQYIGKQIKIKSVETGKYICGENESQLHAEGCVASGLFDITPMTADGWVGLRLQGGNYVSVTDDENHLQTTATDFAEWECFRIYEQHGYHYLLSHKDLKYVQATDEDGRPLKTEIGRDSDLTDATWERFQIEIVGNSSEFSGLNYSAVTSTLNFLSPEEADAFIAFIYNKSRSDITGGEKDRLYDYLTGRIPRGTEEYEYAQMMFLTLSAEAINKHMGSASGRIDTSVNNLTAFLKSKAGVGPDGVVIIYKYDVKTSCKEILKWIIKNEIFEDAESMKIFDTALDGIKDIADVKNKVKDFIAEMNAILDLANLAASDNVRTAYAYYINYVNSRHYLDKYDAYGKIMFEISCEINPEKISELDAFNIVLQTFGIGNSWTNKDIQHLMNIFAEFTYHSQAEFDSYVSFSEETVKLGLGRKMETPAVFHCVDGTDKRIMYSSSKPWVVTISESGEIEANSLGSAVITATASNGKQAVCNVEVVPIPVTGVSLNKTSAMLYVDDSETLASTILPSNATEQTVTWKSSDESVATVSHGVVTGVAEGSATITVTTIDGGYSATCAVVIYPLCDFTPTQPHEAELFIHAPFKGTAYLALYDGQTGRMLELFDYTLTGADLSQTVNTKHNITACAVKIFVLDENGAPMRAAFTPS